MCWKLWSYLHSYLNSPRITPFFFVAVHFMALLRYFCLSWTYEAFVVSHYTYRTLIQNHYFNAIVVYVMTAYLLLWCSVLNSLWSDMQHDYFNTNIWFDLLTPHPGSRVCLWTKYLLPYAVHVASFNLICNMTILWKSLIFASAPFPKSTTGARTHAFKLKSLLICFIFIAALSACKISAKILTIALVIIAKFRRLTFDPIVGVKGGGVKLWHCRAYL